MSKKILIIDDEQDVVEIVKTILKTKDYHVISTTNGEDGLRLINELKPDLILCDLMMPRVSGLEVCRRLKRDDNLKDIPIMVMSAIAKDEKHNEEFWRQGLKVDDFITKPFDPLDLLGRIEYIFRKREYVSYANVNEGMEKVSVGNNKTKSDTSQGAASVNDITTAPPEEVVRIFIEAWNNQRFQLEYSCLSEEMTYGLTKDDYVARRRIVFQESKGYNQIQKVKTIYEASVRSNAAKVIIDKETTLGSRVKITKETYMLKKTADGWKIVSVKINS